MLRHRRLYHKVASLLLMVVTTVTAYAQEASPVVKFYSVDEAAEVEVTPGESQTAQAPLDLSLMANVNHLSGYKCVCEWRIWKADGQESSPLVTRFEENTDYRLTQSGGYRIKLYATFTQGTDTIDYESEVMSVIISESKLTCPNSFSPNGDHINDYFRITARSIVKLDAKFFNRWGQLVHSVTLDTAEHDSEEPNKLVLWDGMQGGKPVKDGVYFLNLYALGSDGIEYKIKKAVNVLKGFLEGNESTGGK